MWVLYGSLFCWGVLEYFDDWVGALRLAQMQQERYSKYVTQLVSDIR